MFERNCSRYFLQETNDESLSSVRVPGKREDFPGSIETNGLIPLIYVGRYPRNFYYALLFFFFFFKLHVSSDRNHSILLIPPRLFFFSNFRSICYICQLFSNRFRPLFFLSFFFFARVKEKRKVKKKNGRTGGGEKGGKIRKPYKPVTGLSGIYLSSPLLPPSVFLLSVIH